MEIHILNSEIPTACLNHPCPVEALCTGADYWYDDEYGDNTSIHSGTCKCPKGSKFSGLYARIDIGKGYEWALFDGQDTFECIDVDECSESWTTPDDVTGVSFTFCQGGTCTNKDKTGADCTCPTGMKKVTHPIESHIEYCIDVDDDIDDASPG